MADALENGQDVRVRVLNIDMERGKFAVTMIPEGYVPPPRGERRERNWDDEWSGPSNGERPQLKQQARAAKAPKRAGSRGTPPVQVGDSIKGRVASAAGFGVFVEIADGFTGLLHENEMIRADGAPMPSIGDEVEVVVASVRGDKVSLTQRSAEEVAQVGARELQGGEGRGGGSSGGGRRQPRGQRCACLLSARHGRPARPALPVGMPCLPPACLPPPRVPPACAVPHRPLRHAPCCPQERELRTAGVSVAANLPSGASPLAQQLARAGISSDQYGVGDHN